MKKLALLLAICLLASMLPMPGWADEADPIAQETDPIVQDAETGSLTGAVGLLVEGGDAATGAAPDGESGSPSAQAEDGEGAAPEASDAPIAPEAPAESDAGAGLNTERDARYSPAFLVGYALVLADAELTDAGGNAAGVSLPAGTVAYAHDRNLDDRLKVAVDSEGGPVIGWLRAEELRPMGEDEIAAFLKTVPAEGARFFDAEGTLPLARLGGWETIQAGGESVDPDAASDPAADPATQPDAGSDTQSTTQPGAGSDTQSTTQPGAGSDTQPATQPDAGSDASTAESDAPAVGELPVDGEDIGETGEGTDGADAAPEDAVRPIHVDPDGPQLSRNEITLGEGETFALNGVMPDGRASGITYTSEDEAVAAVSENGVVTALAVGETRVRAESGDGAWSECLVRVLRRPDVVRFERSTYYIGKGETFSGIRVIVGSQEGQFAGSYTLSSEKRKYVRIASGGAIYGRKTGWATLRVRTYNGLTATCRVKVCKAPKSVKLYADKRAMGEGETGKLSCKLSKKSAGTVTYTSSRPDIVSVDPATGAMQALTPGTARLCAATYNGKRSYVDVTVRSAPRELSLSPEQLTVAVGMQRSLTPVLDEGAAGAVIYASDDPKIASVAADGTVRGVSPGETIVRGTTYNGVAAECAVVVKPAPAYVKLPWRTLYIGLGEVVQLQPDVGDTVSTFSYKSSKKKIVKAYGGGRIYGRKKGTAYVTVKTYNGKSFKLKVVVRKAPKWIGVSPNSAGMCVGETRQLYVSRQKKSSGTVTFSSSDETVATVDPASGLVTAIGAGKAVITARSFNGRTAACEITVYPMPEWIETNAEAVELGVGQSFGLEYRLSPGSRSPVAFSVDDPGVAQVSSDGRITAVAPGIAAVTIETNAPGVSGTVYVAVYPAPEWVSLEPAKLTMNVDEICQLFPSIPDGSMTRFRYASSDDRVAEISADGSVVAVNRGTATLTVTTHNGKTASLKLTVLDPWYPESATFFNVPAQMEIGETRQIGYTVSPADARPRMKWTSGNPAVAAVDEDGLVTARASGYATIRAVSAKNSDIRLEFTLAVQMPGIAMVIPARTTGIDGISENLEKIEAIRATAIAQIDALQSSGAIKKGDANKRRSIVNNIFADYAFPWMTPSLQKYWKKANSEGGAKDFKPGIVYYGMPYISGSGLNRVYNARRALSEGRYTNSGKGYYVLNKKKLLNSKYVGSDCSGLVDQAIWGTTKGRGVDRTVEIDKVSAYKTIRDTKAMRPGDLLCKPYGHVIMFLYYTNPDKTQMMIIENGGSEAGTNTVHCSVMYVSSYTKKGYKIRRLSSLG